MTEESVRQWKEQFIAEVRKFDEHVSKEADDLSEEITGYEHYDFIPPSKHSTHVKEAYRTGFSNVKKKYSI